MVRRSTRTKQTVEVYDPSQQQHVSPASTMSSSPSRKSKPAKSKKTPSSSSEKKKRKRNEDTTDELQQQQQNESSSSDESEPSRQQKPPRKRRSNVVRKKSSKESSDDDTTNKPPQRKPQPAARRGGKKAMQSVNALTTLAKKFANDQDHLAVHLISCWKKLPGQKKRRAAVRQGSSSSPYKEGIEAIVGEFLRGHTDDLPAMEVGLLNLIFHCIGGKPAHILPGTNVQDDWTEEEWADLIDDVTDEMGSCPQDKVLICTHAKLSVGLTEYRKIYEEFWCVLTTTIIENRRWGIDWITSIAQRLVELSHIGVADMRFAITTAIYNIGRALLRSSADVQTKIATATRQLKASKASHSKHKAKDLKEKLRTWTELDAQASTLVQDTIMTSVFPQRYRDARPSIRVASLAALGEYCLTAPALYLQSIYLKYVGWMLFDRESEVRKAALRALLAPFGSTGMDFSGMGPVVSKYLPRLVEICTRDVDKEVQEVAMELTLRLLQNDMFDVPADDSIWDELNLCPLKASGTPTFRRHGLGFVLEQLSAFDDGAFSSERGAAEQIGQLAQWLGLVISEEDADPSDLRYDLVDIVVDSLASLPKHKLLISNWSAMLRALSSEESKKSDDNFVDTARQRVILRMLVSSARRSEAQEDNSERFTLALLRALPDLLVSFKSDTLVLQSLVVLPQFMNPEVFGLSSRRKEFQSLLNALCDLLAESTDQDVLLDCALSLSVFSQSDHPRKDEALAALTDVVTTLRTRLTELLDQKNDNDDDDDQSKDSTTDNPHSSLSLCAFRLLAISKQCSICMLIGGRSNMDEELESLSAGLATYLEKELDCRKVISKTEDEDTVVDLEEVEIPVIWETQDVHTHESIAMTVSSSLSLVLTELAWRVTEELKSMESPNPPVYTDDFVQGHVVVRTTNRLTQWVTSCFDMFLEDIAGIAYSDDHVDFSFAVQQAAIRCVSDLRTLFPHMLSDSTSPLFRACAFTNNDAIGGAIDRFFAVLDLPVSDFGDSTLSTSHLCYLKDEAKEKTKQANEVLLPVARGIATNFESLHRQEVAWLLSFVAGHSKRATELVTGLAKCIKRTNPIRFLEVHMAVLQSEFERWAEQEPADVGDTPTDSQLTQNDEETTQWMAEFDVVVSKATRLAPTLGVGRQRPLNLDIVFRQFFREGLRFAFSTNEGEIPLGSRLSFLSLLSNVIDEIEKRLNEYEAQFREHDDFDEDQSYMESLSAFREACSFSSFTTEDTDTVIAGSTPVVSRRRRSSFVRPRMSTGSSVSSIKSKISKMDSIEEGDEEEEDGASGDKLDDTSRDQGADEDESTVEPQSITSRKRSRKIETDESSPSPENSAAKLRIRDDSDLEDDDSTVAPPTNSRPKRTKYAGSTVGSLSSAGGPDDTSTGGSTAF